MTVCGRTRFCATDSARMRTTCGAARASSGLAGGSSPGRPVRQAAANRRERPSGSDCGWAAVSVSVLCFMPYREHQSSLCCPRRHGRITLFLCFNTLLQQRFYEFPFSTAILSILVPKKFFNLIWIIIVIVYTMLSEKITQFVFADIQTHKQRNKQTRLLKVSYS